MGSRKKSLFSCRRIASLIAFTLIVAGIGSCSAGDGEIYISPCFPFPPSWCESPNTSDTTPPSVSFTNPASDAADIPTTGKINATFSESLDQTSITATTITLSDSSGNPVSGIASYNYNYYNTITFTPSVRHTFVPTAICMLRSVIISIYLINIISRSFDILSIRCKLL
jgi:hypothetical protein